jgi:hypothetical protein
VTASEAEASVSTPPAFGLPVEPRVAPPIELVVGPALPLTLMGKLEAGLLLVAAPVPQPATPTSAAHSATPIG